MGCGRKIGDTKDTDKKTNMQRNWYQLLGYLDYGFMKAPVA